MSNRWSPPLSVRNGALLDKTATFGTCSYYRGLAFIFCGKGHDPIYGIACLQISLGLALLAVLESFLINIRTYLKIDF